MELKDQIRIAREAKGWLREELALRMGVSKTAVKLWEDTGRIKLSNIEKLENVLGVVLHVTGQAPHGMPAFVTPEGLQLLEAIEQLPKALKDAIRTLVMYGKVQSGQARKRIDPFIESVGEAAGIDKANEARHGTGGRRG